MKNNRKTLAFALSGITQLGISVVVSFLLWILIALWVKKAFGLGNYVTVIGILCGVGNSVMAFYNFSKKIIDISKEDDNAD